MSIYNFKKWNGNFYSDETVELLELRYISPQLFRELLTYSNPDHASCLISRDTYKKISNIFVSLKLILDQNQLFNYLIWAQSTYIDYLEIEKSSSIQDFIEEDKDKFMLTKIKAEQDSGSILTSVSFKFNIATPGITPLKSELLLKDITDVLLRHSGIDPEKMESEQIADVFLSKKLYQGTKFIRHLIVKELFTYLKKENQKVSENNVLNFVGEFLHLCQIPVSQNDIDLESFDVSQVRNLLIADRNKF